MGVVGVPNAAGIAALGLHALQHRGQEATGVVACDERGEFHMSVAPGKYYVVAEPAGRNINQVPEVRTDGSVPAIYGKTYHPSAAAKAKAVLVEAAAGAELIGIDIHMARQGRAFNIGGTVTGMTDGAMAMVTLQPVEDPVREKSPAASPVTFSSNVRDAVIVFEEVGTCAPVPKESTQGGLWSTTSRCAQVDPLLVFPVSSVARMRTVCPTRRHGTE